MPKKVGSWRQIKYKLKETEHYFIHLEGNIYFLQCSIQTAISEALHVKVRAKSSTLNYFFQESVEINLESKFMSRLKISFFPLYHVFNFKGIGTCALYYSDIALIPGKCAREGNDCIPLLSSKILCKHV